MSDILQKLKSIIDMNNLNEDILFSYYDGKRIIDYVIEEKKLDYEIIKSVKTHVEIVDLIISLRKTGLIFLRPEIIQKLITKDTNGQYLIEKYINDKESLKYIIHKVNDKNFLLELCKKYNNYEFLKEANEEVLKDRDLLNLLIKEKDIIPNCIKFPMSADFVIFLTINGFYEYIQVIRQETLLDEIGSSETLLEFLLEKGYEPKVRKILDKRIVEILYKKHRPDLLAEVDSKLLLESPFENKEYTYLDYIFECIKKGILKEKFRNLNLFSLFNEERFYVILAKHIVEESMDNFSKNELFELVVSEYEGLPECLLLEETNGKTLLEFLLENGYNLELKYIRDKKLINILYKKDLLKDAVEKNKVENDSLLESTLENKEYTYLDYILECIKDGRIKQSIQKLEPSQNKVKFYKTLDKNNMMDCIEWLNEKEFFEEELLKEDGGQTLLEFLLEKGYDPKFKNGINAKKTIEIFYKKGRFDLLKDAVVNSMVSKAILTKKIEDDKEYTYLDYILECIKNGEIRYKVQDLKPYYNKAMFYIILARNNMLEYVEEVTKEELLANENEKTMLEVLLNIDSNLTINKILSKSIKSQPQIALILKSRGFLQQNINVTTEKVDETANYVKQINNKLGIGPLYQEGEMLLKELISLFLADGKSDKELIFTLASSYKHALMINYENNIQELKRLIDVKKNNFDTFYYIKTEDGNYFSTAKESVYCCDGTSETILHETGHALHYFLANNNVPKDYGEITLKVRQNPEVIERIKKYSDEWLKIEDDVLESIKKECENYFEKYYTKEKKEEIQKQLEIEKSEKKRKYSNFGIDEEQLNIFFNEVFTEEEYIKQQKKIFINEKYNAIMLSEYGFLIAIEDILDAIYEGRLQSISYNLINNESSNAKGFWGHGIHYYYNDEQKCFNEMIAQFACLSKSSDYEQKLKLLKELVGEEVYYMISDFYYENIVGLTIEEVQSEKIGGR